MKVRIDLPERRKVPTLSPKGKDWSDHKPDLRVDFHEHCAYCGSYDGFRHTYFEVDHFVPKSLFEISGNITYCQYDNLVYSCKFCNNKKLSKWPSQDEKIPFINDKGFVDPCLVDFDKQIYRTDSGSIRWLTKLGKWMVEDGFKFDERDHSIKILWELNQLRRLIDKLIEKSKEYQNGSEKHSEIIGNAEKFTFKYYVFHRELMNFYNGE